MLVKTWMNFWKILRAILRNLQMVMLEDQDSDKQKRAIPRQYLYDIVFGEDSTQARILYSSGKSAINTSIFILIYLYIYLELFI